MNNIIEDQIIQYESLVDEKEENLNTNIELFNNISNEFPLFSKSDLFSEITFPTYIEKNEKKHLTETRKILIENQSAFFSKEIFEKNLGLKDFGNDYSEKFNSILDKDNDILNGEYKINFAESENFLLKNNESLIEYRQKPNFNPTAEISKKRKFFRVDDSKKHFKVAINKFATEELNLLIKKSGLPKKLQRKIHLPNYKMFTSNVKELDNLDFLSFELKNIFTYGKNEISFKRTMKK